MHNENRSPLQIGKWLEFDSGTYFGDEHMHHGTILGIDEIDNKIAIIINATHEVEKTRYFQQKHNFAETTVVEVNANDSSCGRTFSRNTAFNCNRVKDVDINDFLRYCDEGKIRLASYNEDVGKQFLQKLATGTYDSPMVPKRIKDIIKTSNELL